MEKIKNYIGGELVKALDGDVIEVYNPSNGVLYAMAPDSSSKDVEFAVEAAKSAFPAWSKLSFEDRSIIFLKIADLIDLNFEKIALAESIDNGKPLSLAKKMDIPRASANLRFFAKSIIGWHTEAHEMSSEEAINYTLRQPLGVVACISPWNLPLYLFTWKIAPALIAGNTVVAKPSEVTPMSAYLFSELCIEAGLPPGVLNIVHGRGERVGDSLTSHPDVKAISFTGSTKVGKHIATITAPLFKKISLEMGGKNPTIIFADCDYDKMLDTVVRSSFINQGQICLCGSRIYIEQSIYEKFKKDFVAKAKQLKVGNPLNDDTNIGAIVSKVHFEKILYHIDLAKKEGGKLLCGGKSVKPENFENGWYIEPTIFEGLENNCRTNQEEIFGPMVTVAPFENYEEALALANESKYGLASSVWTINVQTAHKIGRDLNTGIVWINTWLMRDLRTPFGGMNDSGVGREGGVEALRFFTEAKNVCVKYG